MKSDLNILLNASNASDINSGLDRDFILMNKDTKVATFTVIGDGAFQEVQISNTFIEIPDWIKPLSNFIISRQAPKNRENIKELLKRSGWNKKIGCNF